MTGYVDPFANRSRTQEEGTADGPDPSSDDAAVDDDEDLVDHDDGDVVGLDAVDEDARRGRREAPFADDPAHRVRPA